MSKSLEQQLKDILKNVDKQVQNILGNTISLGELFLNTFIQKHTKFNSLDELFESGGFICNSKEANNIMSIK